MGSAGLYAALAFTLWGIWGFLGKLASNHLAARELVVFSLLGYVLVFPVLIFIALRGMKIDWAGQGLKLALVAGMFSAAAYICYYLAIARGEASRVVTITALYPVLTAILSFVFLHEAVTVPKIAGIICAVAGIVLLSL